MLVRKLVGKLQRYKRRSLCQFVRSIDAGEAFPTVRSVAGQLFNDVNDAHANIRRGGRPSSSHHRAGVAVTAFIACGPMALAAEPASALRYQAARGSTIMSRRRRSVRRGWVRQVAAGRR